MGEQARARRSDAVRNRGRILTAARHLVTERGPQVSMSEIAGHAGVAVGTLYQHFPTKADLVSAVVAEQAGELVDAVVQAWERVRDDHAEPAAELLAFVERVLEAAAVDRAVKAAARSLGAEPEFSDAEARGAAALGHLIDAGRAAGTLRHDLAVSDLYLLVATCPTDQPPEVRRRWLTLVRPGLLRQ